MEFRVLTTTQELNAFCKASHDVTWLALDTEFIREKTYYPNLCLVQIASEKDIVCVDTIAIDNLSSLKELLYQPSITKIFHSASQDLEIFVNLYDAVPTPMFDTQIAASLLGYGEQVSYAHLVNEICEIELDKSLSRTNWERRPLTEKEIRYAVDDVKYLAKVYLFLKDQLSENDRTHWAEFECNTLSALEKYKVNTNEIWKTVKGAGKLASHQLIALKQLAQWRELQAITENKPRRWILSDKALRSLAIEQPGDLDSLQQVEDIHSEHAGYAKSLLDEIKLAQNIPEENWPEASLVGPLSNEQRKLVKQAQSFIRTRAEELNISPSLLATRSVVEKLIRGKRKLDILSSWKKDLIGDELVELIETSNRA
ncbi:MAG: ribonuclease D [Gammaproteobacteria bacterium]